MKIELSQRARGLTPSATLAVSARARAMRDAGVDVIAFAAGEPDFDTADPIKEAAIEALRSGDTKYPSPASGIASLRNAVCAYLKKHCDLHYESGQICVSVGGKHALFLAFQTLLDPDDEVLIPVPYWVSYPAIAGFCGAKPVFVHPRDPSSLKVGPEEIKAASTPRTKMLVLNSPNNPSGAVYSRSELEAIADVLRETRVLVVSDEIYHRLVLDGPPQTSFATIDGMFERTLTVNGASKAFAMTGWRLGFCGGPRELIAAMGRLQGQTTSGATSFVQTAAITALSGDQTPVERMRDAYRSRGRLMCERLNALPGVSCESPHGAFYCFPNVASTFERLGVADSVAFAEEVLERVHVALVPGSAFGSPEHVRLTFATSEPVIDRGLDRLAELLR